MEIDFSLIMDDVEAFNRYVKEARHKAGGPSRQFLWRLLLVGVAVIIPTTWHFAEAPWTMVALLIPFLVGAIVGAVGVGIFFWWIGKIAISSSQSLEEEMRKHGLFDSRRVSFNDTGVTISTKDSNIFHRWPAIQTIDATNDHVFFFTEVDQAYVLPRRAFREERHFEEFVALARQYQQGRGQQVSKPTGIIAALPPQSDAFSRPEAP